MPHPFFNGFEDCPNKTSRDFVGCHILFSTSRFVQEHCGSTCPINLQPVTSIAAPSKDRWTFVALQFAQYRFPKLGHCNAWLPDLLKITQKWIRARISLIPSKYVQMSSNKQYVDLVAWFWIYNCCKSHRNPSHESFQILRQLLLQQQ